MKQRKAHRVPLPPRALAILPKCAASIAEVIFPGWRPGRPVDDNTVSRVLQRLAGPLTAHGFRSSLRTWAAERTNFAPEIAEAALAHAIKSDIERAYKRTTFFDHRRKLMEAWADYCDGAATVDGWRGGGDARRSPWLRTDAHWVKWASDALALMEQGDGIQYYPSDMRAFLHRLIELIEAERRRRGRPASVSKRKPPKFSNTGLLAWAREPTKDRRMVAVALRRFVVLAEAEQERKRGPTHRLRGRQKPKRRRRPLEK